MTGLFFVTIVFDEVRTKILCNHTELIIVWGRLGAVKKDRLLVFYACRVCYGSKNSKNVLFRSIMTSKRLDSWQFPVNKLIKFGPCWEAPYSLLVTFWQLSYRISWENGGRNRKTMALIAGAPFPFPLFRAFLPTPNPSPFCVYHAG